MHGKALVVVIAYDIYLEVADGDVLTICGYKLLNFLYMGDENMWVYVQQHKLRIENRGRPQTNEDRNKITSEKIKQARHTMYCLGRLCGDLELFQKHIASKQNWKYAKPCE
eukprot:11118775-Ditylum_brightwellii.AAC.1